MKDIPAAVEYVGYSVAYTDDAMSGGACMERGGTSASHDAKLYAGSSAPWTGKENAGADDVAGGATATDVVVAAAVVYGAIIADTDVDGTQVIAAGSTTYGRGVSNPLSAPPTARNCSLIVEIPPPAAISNNPASVTLWPAELGDCVDSLNRTGWPLGGGCCWFSSFWVETPLLVLTMVTMFFTVDLLYVDPARRTSC